MTTVEATILRQLRALCLALPEAYEEPAWIGTRWCIRQKNFCHVLVVKDGRPAGYAAPARLLTGTATVVTFRSALQEQLGVFSGRGDPWFAPSWWPNIVGLKIDDRTDWRELTLLLKDSYRLLAPKKLAALVTEKDP